MCQTVCVCAAGSVNGLCVAKYSDGLFVSSGS